MVREVIHNPCYSRRYLKVEEGVGAISFIILIKSLSDVSNLKAMVGV